VTVHITQKWSRMHLNCATLTSKPDEPVGAGMNNRRCHSAAPMAMADLRQLVQANQFTQQGSNEQLIMYVHPGLVQAHLYSYFVLHHHLAQADCSVHTRVYAAPLGTLPAVGVRAYKLQLAA
jgi:hypothetical protein